MEPLTHPTAAPLVSVVLVNYNSSAYTLACVESIYATAGDMPVEIIVVDNGSRMEQWQALEALPAQVERLRSRLNLGFSGGNMLGVLRARGQYLFLLNNDTLLQPSCLQRLVAAMEALPSLGICAPEMLDEQHQIIRWTGYFPRPEHAWWGIKRLNGELLAPGIKAYDYVSGSAMFIRASVMNALGGMDLSYFLYWEEEDICWRVRRAGHQVALIPAAAYVHFGNGSSAINEPMVREFYISLRRFMFKNMAWWQAALSYLFFIFKETTRLRKGWVHGRLALFLLRGAAGKHSLRHKQVLLDE